MSKNPFLVRIADLPPEGREVSFSEPFIAGRSPQGSFDTRELGMECAGPIEAKLHLEKLGNVLRVKGRVQFAFTMPCARSNEPVPCRFDEPIDLSLRRAGTGHVQAPGEEGEEPWDGEEEDKEAGQELLGADLDEWTYSGEELDLSPILYEHIALNLPLKVVAERFRDAPELAYADKGQETLEAEKSPFAALKNLKIEP